MKKTWLVLAVLALINTVRADIPVIYSGDYAKLTTLRGLMQANGNVLENDGEINIIKNGGGELDTLYWTASAGSFSATTTVADVFQGKKTLAFNASASGQTVSNAAVTITGLAGATGYGECYVKTAASDYILEVMKNGVSTATVTLDVSATYTHFQTPNFTFPTTGAQTVQLRVRSASDAAIIYFDACAIRPAKPFSLGSSNILGDLYVSGKVGIGVSAPLTALHLKATTNDLVPEVTLENTNSGNSAATFITFRNDRGYTGFIQSASSGFDLSSNAATRLQIIGDAENPADDAIGGVDILATDPGGDIRFYTSSYEDIRMQIDQDGNVGIGTTAPAKTLDVVGSIGASGNVTIASTSSSPLTIAGSRPGGNYTSSIQNTSNGAGAQTDFRVLTDASTLLLAATSVAGGDGATFSWNGAGGMDINASHASGDIRIKSRNTLALTLGGADAAFSGALAAAGAISTTTTSANAISASASRNGAYQIRTANSNAGSSAQASFIGVTDQNVLELSGDSAAGGADARFIWDGSGGLDINASHASGTLRLKAANTIAATFTGANTQLAGTLGVTGVATLTAQPVLSSLTASLPVFTDSSKGLVSNTMTGTGNVMMSGSPTTTGTMTAQAINASGTVAVTSTAASGLSFKHAADDTTQILIGNNTGVSEIDLTLRLQAGGNALIFSDTGKNLALGSNGANARMTVLSSGNVGVGNTTDTYKFDVTGTLNASGATTLGSTLAITGTTQHTGNVGIGAGSSALSQLQVTSPTTVTGTNTNSASGTAVTGTGTKYLTEFHIGDGITMNAETRTISAIASDTALTTDAWTGANTGATATRAATADFYIYPNGAFQSGGTRTSFVNLLSSNNNVISASAAGASDATSPQANLVLASYTGTAAGGPNLILMKSRGTEASPGATTSGDALGNVFFRGYDTSIFTGTGVALTGSATQTWTASAHGSQLLLRTVPNGSTTVTTALTLGQDQGATFVSLAGTGSRAVLADANGLLSAPVSDARLKRDVVDLDEQIDSLAAIRELRGVFFHWDTSKDRVKNHGSQQEIGMIAQEVEKIVPQAVTQDRDGWKSLDYSHLVPLLVEGVKHLENRVEALEKENRALKGQ